MQSANEALTFLGKGQQENTPPVDMVISDIEMPGMDGFTLTRSIREIPVLRDFKIMLHSSMSNPNNQLKAHQMGANDFVAKSDPAFPTQRIAALCDLPPSENRTYKIASREHLKPRG